ncbi:MAG: MarR family winged helix-turn-helix transcriptional regulator [Mariprofundus sp.]
MISASQHHPKEGLGSIMPLAGCMSSHVRYHISRICKAAGYNLTPEESGILMIIRHFDGLPQSQLASILGKDKAAVTRLISVLVKSGLVGREQDEQDRRIVRACITDEGERAFVQLWPELMKLSNQALNGISEADLDCMRQVFFAINANLAVLTEQCNKSGD